MAKQPVSVTIADPVTESEAEPLTEDQARRRRAYEKLMALQARRIKLDIDIDELRGRNRH